LLTGKQRTYLKGLAHDIQPITQIGKEGITDAFISQLNDALEARELVKVTVQKNSFLDTKEAANEVARLTNSEFVQAIGRRFVLYKKSKNNPKITLPV
jgi:RNA-binding protein